MKRSLLLLQPSPCTYAVRRLGFTCMLPHMTHCCLQPADTNALTGTRRICDIHCLAPSESAGLYLRAQDFTAVAMRPSFVVGILLARCITEWLLSATFGCNALRSLRYGMARNSLVRLDHLPACPPGQNQHW
ncbi:hypothetical protein BV20DRAFT_372605 [Pilatotrama ljubarskyi]|nr:hypothetical protein BV20DRAFT_372605 [Pilatotrama ljubarskyi]